jgi:hypothetical protein
MEQIQVLTLLALRAQILTRLRHVPSHLHLGTVGYTASGRLLCFTGTKLQLLTQVARDRARQG